MTHELNGKKIVVVDVPEDATKFFIALHDDLNLVWRNEAGVTGCETIPEGNYTLLGLVSEIKEDVCRELVEMAAEEVMIDWDVIHGDVIGNVYKDYNGDNIIYTATESLHSFIRSIGKEPDRIVILLEKI